MTERIVLSSGAKMARRPVIQKMLTNLRRADYEVVKDKRFGTYTVRGDVGVVLRAYPMGRYYLMSYNTEVIEPVEEEED